MAKAIDPVCHMEVDTANPPGGRSEYQGTSYYFCAPGCKRAFEQDPGKYLSGQPEASSFGQKADL
jgi:xanthine dehydrogenase accessory factor